jgi:hypothetical protein
MPSEQLTAVSRVNLAYVPYAIRLAKGNVKRGFLRLKAESYSTPEISDRLPQDPGWFPHWGWDTTLLEYKAMPMVRKV